MAVRRYTVVLDPNPGTDVYTVTVPALLGCVTEGHGMEAALGNARAAVAGYLDALAALGDPIPKEADALEIRTIDVDGADEAAA